MNKLLIICGPTATGKTKLAALLAKKFNGELISADSRQVYRGMDLTTGKERPDVPTWLYDVVDPNEDFSVSHWVRLARETIADIQKRKKLPVVVGGTGLYIKALLEPFETIDIPPDKQLRQKLETLSVEELQTMVDRGNMNDSDWSNPRRLIRKIEITKSKKPVRLQKPYKAFVIGLTAPLRDLDERIDKRLQERKKQGLNEEIQRLLKKYRPNLPAMSALRINEHAYARSQLTWFKKQKDIHWFAAGRPGFLPKVEKAVGQWYTT